MKPDIAKPQQQIRWIDTTDQKIPLGKNILVTDGKEIALCMVTLETREDHTQYYCMNGVGISGYEWEFNFEYDDITHWMAASELSVLYWIKNP